MILSQVHLGLNHSLLPYTSFYLLVTKIGINLRAVVTTGALELLTADRGDHSAPTVADSSTCFVDEPSPHDAACFIGAKFRQICPALPLESPSCRFAHRVLHGVSQQEMCRRGRPWCWILEGKGSGDPRSKDRTFQVAASCEL